MNVPDKFSWSLKLYACPLGITMGGKWSVISQNPLIYDFMNNGKCGSLFPFKLRAIIDFDSIFFIAASQILKFDKLLFKKKKCIVNTNIMINLNTYLALAWRVNWKWKVVCFVHTWEMKLRCSRGHPAASNPTKLFKLIRKSSKTAQITFILSAKILQWPTPNFV